MREGVGTRGRSGAVVAVLLTAATILPAQDAVLEALRRGRTPALEQQIVGLARQAVELKLREGRTLNVPADLPAVLQRQAGVFVSLGVKGRDRGCRGTLEPTQANLAAEIIASAVAAATEDRRFAPLSADELNRVEYFVSIVGRLEPIRGPEKLRPGIYGLAMRGPAGTAILLPGEARTADWQWREGRRRAGLKGRRRGTAWRFRTVLFRGR